MRARCTCGLKKGGGGQLLMAVLWVFCGGPLLLGAPSAELWQVRNGPADAPIDPVDWVKGNANPANSHLVEDQSVPYRLVLNGLTTGPHRVVIEWDTKEGGRHAIDYLTHYERLIPHDSFPGHREPERVDPLSGLPGPFGEPAHFAVPRPGGEFSPVEGQPGAGFDTLPEAERSLTIWNGQIDAVAYLSEGRLDGVTASTRLAIEFTASSSVVVLAWGGHIAAEEDWGEGNSATGITGASYHMRLIGLDGTGGNQDRSLQALAVRPPPPECWIEGPDRLCGEQTAVFAALLDPPEEGGVYQWSLVGDAPAGVLLGAVDGETVMVQAGVEGLFALRVEVVTALGISEAVIEVGVDRLVTVEGLADQEVCPGRTVVWEARAEGAGPYDFVWYKDGVLLPGEQGSRLTLENVEAGDAGLYCVDVTGACNTARQCASLAVEIPFSIQCPGDVSVECLPSLPPPDVASVEVLGGLDGVRVMHAGDETVVEDGVLTVVRTYVGISECGVEAHCSQRITVVDRTAPVIECPADRVVSEDPVGSMQAVVFFEAPVVSDNCELPVAVECDPPSGASFEAGMQTVRCVAVDGGGNRAECAFSVHVVPFTLVASSTADSGPGTLRQALLDANAAPGSNEVVFDFPGEPPYVIELLTPLPEIMGELSVDGWSQITFSGFPVVEVDGEVVGDPPGSGDGSVGLVVRAPKSMIRGLVLKGFDTGLVLAAPGVRVEGNYIGVDPMEADPGMGAGNQGDGILVLSAWNVIGDGSRAGANVIGANGGNGIRVEGPGATDNSILGNWIGIDPESRAPRPNGMHGVVVSGGAGTNLIQGNLIVFNGRSGVALEPSAGLANRIVTNRFTANGELGIDLNADGPTLNDSLDLDDGPNGLLNHPVLTFGMSDPISTMIEGRLEGAPNQGFEVEFFQNVTEAGQGEEFLGSMSLQTDGSGAAVFKQKFAVGSLGGRTVTATATDRGGNTSELAPALVVVSAPTIIVPPPTSTVDPGGSRTLCVTADGSEPLTYQWRRNGANIPDATNACYTIPVAELADGGTYTVVVANPFGVVTSEPAKLFVEVPTLASIDQFAGRELLLGTNGAIAGVNAAASVAPGEPLHGGKPGGHSVWYAWTAPATGIAVIRTVGSTFDTLLAVYTGDASTNLVLVAEDEDRGGYYTSEARFNAVAGTPYAIAVDGLGGAVGEFILSWSMLLDTQLLPTITTQPASQTIEQGGTAVFVVEAESLCKDGHHDCRHDDKDHHDNHEHDEGRVSYQWFHNGQPIEGATESTLIVSGAMPGDLGLYWAVVTDLDVSVQSRVVSLQFNITGELVQQVLMMDKFFDATLAEPLRLGRGLPVPASGGLTPASLVSGYSGSHILSTFGDLSEGEVICGVVGGASAWMEFVVSDSGMLHFDTAGSSFDTVIEVQRDVNGVSVPLMCNDNAMAGVTYSSVDVEVEAGVTHYLVVDARGGVFGVLQLNYELTPPLFLTALGVTPSGQSLIRVTGFEGMNVRLERSRNFVDWVPLITTNSAAETFDYVDSDTAEQNRFYRAVVLP